MAAILRHDAELVVACGHARLVAQRLFNGEGFLVPALGLTKMAAILRHHAELVIGDSMALACLLAVAALRARGDPAINGFGLGESTRSIRTIAFGAGHE